MHPQAILAKSKSMSRSWRFYRYARLWSSKLTVQFVEARRWKYEISAPGRSDAVRYGRRSKAQPLGRGLPGIMVSDSQQYAHDMRKSSAFSIRISMAPWRFRIRRGSRRAPSTFPSVGAEEALTVPEFEGELWAAQNGKTSANPDDRASSLAASVLSAAIWPSG